LAGTSQDVGQFGYFSSNSQFQDHQNFQPSQHQTFQDLHQQQQIEPTFRYYGDLLPPQQATYLVENDFANMNLVQEQHHHQQRPHRGQRDKDRRRRDRHGAEAHDNSYQSQSHSARDRDRMQMMSDIQKHANDEHYTVQEETSAYVHPMLTPREMSLILDVVHHLRYPYAEDAISILDDRLDARLKRKLLCGDSKKIHEALDKLFPMAHDQGPPPEPVIYHSTPHSAFYEEFHILLERMSYVNEVSLETMEAFFLKHNFDSEMAQYLLRAESDAMVRYYHYPDKVYDTLQDAKRKILDSYRGDKNQGQ
jgi:hypothetical protein